MLKRMSTKKECLAFLTVMQFKNTRTLLAKVRVFLSDIPAG